MQPLLWVEETDQQGKGSRQEGQQEVAVTRTRITVRK